MATFEKTCEIVNEKGLHVRAATLVAQLAATFSSTVTLEHGGERANAKSVMNLLLLTAPMGATVRIAADGDDAQDALEAIRDLITGGFGE